MKVVFLGTGTSQGVPMIAHDNPGLDLSNPRNWRTRSSIHVVMDGHHVQVDAGPEFRLQCLRNEIRWIDTFILTHGHADHIMGMDDLRRFCDIRESNAIPVYTTDEGLQRIRNVYPYAIGDKPTHPGYPAFQVALMPERLETPGGLIQSALLPHGSVEVLGLVFTEKSTGARFAYYSDCKTVTPQALEIAYRCHAVALDGLRIKPHPTHMTIYDAIETAALIQASKTYITHTTFQIDYDTWEKQLPPNVHLAYDSLTLELP